MCGTVWHAHEAISDNGLDALAAINTAEFPVAVSAVK